MKCNLILFCFILLRGKPNDIHFAVQEAIRRTGLRDMGNSSEFIQRYDVARKLGFARSKSQLTPFGYYILQETLTRRMVTKLSLFDYLKKHPSIADVPIKNPIFVIGFPRTGTTFLHELLGLHPKVQMHHSWAQMEPVPPMHDESPAAQHADRTTRYETNKSRFTVQLQLAGTAIQRIHRIKYDDPEEYHSLLS